MVFIASCFAAYGFEVDCRTSRASRIRTRCEAVIHSRRAYRGGGRSFVHGCTSCTSRRAVHRRASRSTSSRHGSAGLSLTDQLGYGRIEFWRDERTLWHVSQASEYIAQVRRRRAFHVALSDVVGDGLLHGTDVVHGISHLFKIKSLTHSPTSSWSHFSGCPMRSVR